MRRAAALAALALLAASVAAWGVDRRARREGEEFARRYELPARRPEALASARLQPSADHAAAVLASTAVEDETGRPFVGPAGRLLTDIIEKGMGLRRGDVYIANIVKCRPPGNRDPLPEEIRGCSGFLDEQIGVIGPKVIVALGRIAAQTLLATETPISRLRGRFGEYRGVKVMPTYHPSYLLHNPARKRDVWEDIKTVMQELGIPLPG